MLHVSDSDNEFELLFLLYDTSPVCASFGCPKLSNPVESWAHCFDHDPEQGPNPQLKDELGRLRSTNRPRIPRPGRTDWKIRPFCVGTGAKVFSLSLLGSCDGRHTRLDIQAIHHVASPQRPQLNHLLSLTCSSYLVSYPCLTRTRANKLNSQTTRPSKFRP